MKTPFPQLKLGNKSLGFYITKGLWQRCSLSHTLFKIYIQNALENWQKKMCKDGIGDSGYDNIFNAICRWPIINCTRLWGFRIHDKEINRWVWVVGFKTKC